MRKGMERIGRRAGVWLGALALVGACGAAVSGAGASAKHPSSARRLVAVDPQLFRQKLASLKGHVVVVNLWATWCQPCVHEFPDLVRFERTYRARGVTVLGVSIDDPQHAQQLVPPFLAEQHAGYPILVIKPGKDPTKIVAVVDPFWEGAIPMTYFLDRAGHLKTRLSGMQSYDAFETAIKPLLAKG